MQQKTNIADKPNTPALPQVVATSYRYDRANRMLEAGATQFTYDKNGNRTGMSGPERAIEYAYDYDNHLIGAKTYDVLKNKRNLRATLDFTYDGLGRRLERGVSDRGKRKTAGFLYDGLGYDLLAQYVDPGQPRTTYYYRDQQQVLSRHEIQGNGAGLQYFHHYDGLGSVSAWSNQAGRDVQEYTYAPFGRLIDNNGPDNTSSSTVPHNLLTFSGKMWDKELETYYFGARDYDPAQGIWLTQDPYRGRLIEPMTLHRYGYVWNNPVNLVDINGFDVRQNVSIFFEKTGNFFSGRGWKDNQTAEKERQEEIRKAVAKIIRQDAPCMKNNQISDRADLDYTLQGRNFTEAEYMVILTNLFDTRNASRTPSIAENETVRRFGGQGEDDRSDAFRHAYWNALMVKYSNKDYAKDIATAHETASPNTMPKTMDLHNNEVGRTIGEIYKDQSDDAIADAVKNQLDIGNLWYIDTKGTQDRSDDVLLNTDR